jgi:hypothetical protein
MTLLSFLILLLIAEIYGAIGRAIVGFRGGILVSIAIGFIGALIGMWLSVALGLREMFAVYVGAGANKISTTIYSGLDDCFSAIFWVLLQSLGGDAKSPALTSRRAATLKRSATNLTCPRMSSFPIPSTWPFRIMFVT